MQDENIKSLIVKYMEGEATEKETKQIDDWYQSFDKVTGLTNQMTEEEREVAVNKSYKKLQSRFTN